MNMANYTNRSIFNMNSLSNIKLVNLFNKQSRFKRDTGLVLRFNNILLESKMHKNNF